ncbi:MAG: two-component regulator propeller domain-containing protein [Verrucomicrobiota bacterium]
MAGASYLPVNTLHPLAAIQKLNRSKYRRLLVPRLLLGAIYLASLVCGAADPSNSPFLVDVWGTQQGLPQSSVISVIQSKDGYLWLGTLNGLVRFDGVRFDVFNQENTPGLESDRIVYLFQDSQTNLWVGTETRGVAMVDGGKVTDFPRATSGPQGKVIYAFEDKSNAVWFYTEDGRTSDYRDGEMHSEASVVYPELLLRASRTWLPSRAGGSFAIQNGRVQKWGERQVEKDFGPSPWGNTPVTSLAEDGQGNLIVGTLGLGVFWYDANGKYQTISTEQGLSSAYVLSLCMDSEGNLWVGTDGGGLDRVKRRVFEVPEIHPWAAQSLATDTNGGLWLAFGARGVSYWHADSVQDFPLGPLQGAWQVLVDHHQQVWAGTREGLENGLYWFRDGTFQAAPRSQLLGPQIFALFEDRVACLWAGAQTGLGRWDGTNWSLYTARDGLSGSPVRAIAEDAHGNLWVGTGNGGLNVFDGRSFTIHWTTTNGLPGDDISCLCPDPDGTLWVGTLGHGLARFSDGKWTHYSTSDGLASSSISYIIDDGEGCLWIGSNAGLMRIQKRSLADFANGVTNVIACRIYAEEDGLPTRECSSGSQPAAIRTADGTLWFPTVKGVVSVNPQELRPNSRPPQVMIESVRVNGQEQETNQFNSPGLQAITIAPGNKQLEVQLEIRYAGLNFTAPEAVRFKYRLEGHSTQWTDAGITRVAYFSAVPPGSYHFHVTACNEDGQWNDSGALLAITVEPEFWQTAWFRAALVLAVLGIIVGIVRRISTQKLQRQLQALKQKEALEKERSRIARDLHDQLGANLTQVALLGEMAEADKDAPGEVESHARQISQTARETTRSLDEIVWAVNPANDTLDGLANYACKYAQEYLALAGLRYRADVPAQLPPGAIPPEVRHNVFLAFKEAVNNVVKHAQATEARIRLRLQPESFTLEIEDNGRGLGAADAGAPTRNGLRNMRKRMEDIGGDFWIGPATGQGTVVRLTAPMGRK